MEAKLRLTSAVLCTLLLATSSAIAHAESQAEWSLRQQQMTDGYTAPYDPSYTTYLRGTPLSALRSAAPCSTGKDAQAQPGPAQVSAEAKSGMQKTE